MFKAFLIKYAEIGIKGKNRYMFEDALIRQMEYVLKDVEGTFRVTKEQGRIYVQTEGAFDYLGNAGCAETGIWYCIYLSGCDLRGRRI